MRNTLTNDLVQKRRGLPIALAIVALSFVAVPGAAAADKGLPKADKILDRHVKETGGAEAYKKLKSRRIVGAVEAKMGSHPAHEVSIEIRAKAPNFWRLDVTSDVISMTRVCAKDHAWESRGDEGVRELEGAEKTQSLEDAVFYPMRSWRKHYAKVETLGVKKIDDRDAYEVQVDTRGGQQILHYYDKESGRLIQTNRTVERSSGELKVETKLQAYEKFDGVWVPTKLHQQLDMPGVGKGEQKWTYKEIEHNVDVSDKLFIAPKSKE